MRGESRRIKWCLQFPVDNSMIGSVVRKKNVVNKRQWRNPVYELRVRFTWSDCQSVTGQSLFKTPLVTSSAVLLRVPLVRIGPGGQQWWDRHFTVGGEEGSHSGQAHKPGCAEQMPRMSQGVFSHFCVWVCSPHPLFCLPADLPDTHSSRDKFNPPTWLVYLFWCPSSTPPCQANLWISVLDFEKYLRSHICLLTSAQRQADFYEFKVILIYEVSSSQDLTINQGNKRRK